MRYWIFWNDLVQGPFDVKELQALSAFTAELLVCEEDGQDWAPAAAISDLLPYFQSAISARGAGPGSSPPPPPPARPPTLIPLQGEFFSESPGQQQLFDLNGTRHYYFRPVPDNAVNVPEAAPPSMTTPFHFVMFLPPTAQTKVSDAPVRPPAAKTPERDAPEHEETEWGVREPEDTHPHEPAPQFIAPPLESPPPVEAAPAPVSIPDFAPFNAPVPEEDTFTPVIEPASREEWETPVTPLARSGVKSGDRLWPWLVGSGMVLGVIGVAIYMFMNRVPAPEQEIEQLPVELPTRSVSTDPIRPATKISPKTVPIPVKKTVWQAVEESAIAEGESMAAPTAVAFDAQGQLWVTDQANNRVQTARVSPSADSAVAVQTTGWQTFGESGGALNQMKSPAGVAVDARGAVWMADQGNNRLQVYDPVAQKWTSVGSAGSNPGEFNTPAGVAADRQGQIWVADKGNNRLQVHDPATRHWTPVGEGGSEAGQFNAPAGVAVDGQGRIWVADQGNHRVQVFNPVTKQWRSLGQRGAAVGQLESPASVAVDAKGRVWVADQGNHRVQVYNPSTKRWIVLGRKGRKTGEFNKPSGVALDRQGNIWVADQGNHRLQVAPALAAAPRSGGTLVRTAAPAVTRTEVPGLGTEIEASPETPHPAPVTSIPVLSTPPAVLSPKDKWRGREQEAITMTLKKKIYGGKRTVEVNARIMLDNMHDKELLQAAETGERLYLPDKVTWSALREEGTRYRVYLNFLAWLPTGERSLARSDQFAVDLQRKTVTPVDDSTRHDFYDAATMLTHQHSAKAADIQTVLDGVDLVNKHKLRAVIMKADKQKEEQKKTEAGLKEAETKLQKQFVYFRTRYAEKTLQNIAKAYAFMSTLKGK